MTVAPSSGVVPITVPLGTIPTYVLQNQPGKTLQIINTSKDTVWVSANAGMVANTPGTTSIPGFTTAQWSAPGGVYLIADPAASAPINVQVTYTATNWQPSPVAVGEAVAANGTFIGWASESLVPLAQTSSLSAGNFASLQVDPTGYTAIVIRLSARSADSIPASTSFGVLAVEPSTLMAAGSKGQQFSFACSSSTPPFLLSPVFSVWVPTFGFIQSPGFNPLLLSVEFDPAATISGFSMAVYGYKGPELGREVLTEIPGTLYGEQRYFTQSPFNITSISTTPTLLPLKWLPKMNNPTLDWFVSPTTNPLTVSRTPTVQLSVPVFNGNTFDVIPVASITGPAIASMTVGTWYNVIGTAFPRNLPAGFYIASLSWSVNSSTVAYNSYLALT